MKVKEFDIQVPDDERLLPVVGITICSANTIVRQETKSSEHQTTLVLFCNRDDSRKSLTAKNWKLTKDNWRN
jgi:hypothetical protein